MHFQATIAYLDGPSWIKADRYNITAKVGEQDVPVWERLTPNQKDRTIQALLADRLKLQFHRETRESPIYALVLAKSGPKLHEAKPGDAYLNGLKGPAGPEGPHTIVMQHGKITGQGVSIADLLEVLSNLDLGRAIVDKTGLTGRYDFTLEWTPDDIPAAASTVGGRSLFTALQEELGLKLEPQRGPVDSLAIDHIEMPSPN